MLLSEKNSPEDVYLAPRDYCSYVLLINTGSGDDNNCRSLRCFFHGQPRVIVYTIRKIEAGEQLLYDYGKKYRFIDE